MDGVIGMNVVDNDGAYFLSGKEINLQLGRVICV